MAFRIVWKSTSKWAGTTRTIHEDEEVFETLEQASAAKAELESDSGLMEDLYAAAVQDQGVEGWLGIEKVAP